MPETAPDRLEVARMLREAGKLLAVRRENRFRAKAYEAGARALEGMSEDLGALVRERRLTSVAGIGPSLAAIITEIHETGTARLLEKLRAEIRPGTAELARIPGMTPRRVGAVQAALGIESVAGLKAACERGLLRSIEGFGEATERKILEGIERHEAASTTSLLPHAIDVGEALRDLVRRIPGCAAAEIGGALRRFEEIVPGIDLVAAFSDRAAACREIARFPAVAEVEHESPDECRLRLADGLRARIVLVSPDAFCRTLHRVTGSERHLRRLDSLPPRPARAIGRREASAKEQKAAGCFEEERDLYARLGLPFVPPELREDAGEIEAGLAGDAFEDLVGLPDIQGMVHCHTTYSDGRNTIEQMARAAHALGMKYITITDHSPSATYAGGLTMERLRQQWDEIERVRETVPIRIFRGTESDILADGSLDYPLDVLEQMDVVIASIHTRHKMDEAAMTWRVIEAMRQPVFKIWGHALGRLLRRRDPIPCRVEDVLDAIGEARAAIEINGDPHRLDLEPRWVREARKRGIDFVLSTDAHSVAELRNIRFAVGIARRGGVRRGEVLNALDPDAFARAVNPRRG